jgi:UDP-glucose 4-epimerase
MSDESSPAARARAVVLGGCGFIGSHVCRALLARGNSVRVFDKVYAGRELLRDIEGEVEIVEGDIARPDDVLAAIEGCETVVNLVHTTVPGSSMHDPAYDVESNVVAAVRWLSRLGETGARKIVFVSSGGTVYGVPQSELIDEGHPTEPISSYGVTKLAIEKYVAMYASMCGARHRILRPSNVYGEGQRLHIGQGVIGVLADRALRGEALEVWGEGTSLRDYLYVSDLVAAMMALLDYEGPHHVFNVASGEGRSVLDILAVLGRQLGRLPEVTHTPARSFDVPANVLDYSRLRAETGWRPRVSLDEGVARVLRWLKGGDSDEGDAQTHADDVGA